MLKNILISIITIFLASCSLFSPVKTTPTKTYVLNALPQHITKKPQHRNRITLLVTQPQTQPLYNTTGMVYSIHPYQVAYFSYNRWAETPPQMLHPLIIQALQATRFFHAVNSPTVASRYDYTLNTQLLELKQVFYAGTSEVHFTLRAQLVRFATNQVIKSKQFSVVIPAMQKTPFGGVIAANRATAIVLQELTQFCLQTLG